MRGATTAMLIGLIWLAGLGAAAQFGKVGVAVAAFAAAYPVPPVWQGFLVSSVGLCGLIFGVVGGVIVDRFGLRRALIAGLLGGAVFSALQALLPPFGVMIGLRLAEGAAHLAIVVAGPVLMSACASDRTRPAVMTLWSSFFGVSYMLVALLSVPLIAAVGLRGFLLAHGGYMLILGLAIWWLLPAPPARPAPPAMAARDWLAEHLRIYRSPFMAAPGLGFVWYTAMYIALLTYLPGFVAEAGRATMASVMPLAGIAVSLSLGVLLLRLIAPVRLVLLGFAAVALAVLPLVWTLGRDAAFVWAAVGLIGVTGLIPGGSFAALSDLNEDLTDRARATGALAQLGNVGTTSGPPVLAALISGFGLGGVLGFVLALCAAGVATQLWMAARRAHSAEG